MYRQACLTWTDNCIDLTITRLFVRIHIPEIHLRMRALYIFLSQMCLGCLMTSDISQYAVCLLYGGQVEPLGVLLYVGMNL